MIQNKAVIASDGLLLGFYTLKMEAVCSFETSEPWTTAWCTNPNEDHYLFNSHCENLRTSVVTSFEVLSWDFPGETEVNCKDTNESSRCLGQDLNAGSPDSRIIISHEATTFSVCVVVLLLFQAALLPHHCARERLSWSMWPSWAYTRGTSGLSLYPWKLFAHLCLTVLCWLTVQ
jgi:hypothetical protein